ncbi:transposon Ty3-I Gag-Pol polyprotein [Trichonephila clavipes]|nr:transposon Ty3-I Gag-Pol polyprotein [Trichonephila clavipes]
MRGVDNHQQRISEQVERLQGLPPEYGLLPCRVQTVKRMPEGETEDKATSVPSMSPLLKIEELTDDIPFLNTISNFKSEQNKDPEVANIRDEMVRKRETLNLMMKAKEARKLAKIHLTRAQDKDKCHYDERHWKVNYKDGDLVWIFTPIRKVALSEKLLKLFYGPYMVTKRLSEVTYEVEPCD